MTGAIILYNRPPVPACSFQMGPRGSPGARRRRWIEGPCHRREHALSGLIGGVMPYYYYTYYRLSLAMMYNHGASFREVGWK
jgi:hypothetical protein